MNSRKYANEPLKSDEIEDVFCILDTALKRKNLKGITICLNILSSNHLCHGSCLKSIPEKYIKTMETIASAALNQFEVDFDDEKSYKELEANK